MGLELNDPGSLSLFHLDHRISPFIVRSTRLPVLFFVTSSRILQVPFKASTSTLNFAFSSKHLNFLECLQPPAPLRIRPTQYLAGGLSP